MQSTPFGVGRGKGAGGGVEHGRKHVNHTQEPTVPPGGDQALKCRRLAGKAERRAAETGDPEMRTSFLSMKELWLYLADEIDRRQSEGFSGSQPQ